jgi:hypothetical protein
MSAPTAELVNSKIIHLGSDRRQFTAKECAVALPDAAERNVSK